MREHIEAFRRIERPSFAEVPMASTLPSRQSHQTLAELVADVAAADPRRTAIIFQDQPIGYGSLNAQIERAADGLVAQGIRRGDRVALMLPNVPEFVVAYYAVLRLG